MSVKSKIHILAFENNDYRVSSGVIKKKRETQHMYEALRVKAVLSFSLQVWNSAVCPHESHCTY